MQLLFSTLGLAVCANVLAVPESISKRAGVQYDDTFDDLATSIVTPQVYPVGLYNGLSWGGVVVLTSSTVKTFDLQSFWWGFGTDTGTTAGLAQGGSLTVVAYDVNGNQLPTASFNFASASTLNTPLVYAELPSTWVNLKNVTFAVAVSEPVTERTYIVLDNVRHVNHS